MCFSQIRTQTQASQDPLQEILRLLEPPNLDSALMHVKPNDFFMYFPHLLQTTSKASWVQRVRVYNLTSRYPPDLTFLGLFCFVFLGRPAIFESEQRFWYKIDQESYIWLLHLYFLCTDGVGLWLKRRVLINDSAFLSSPNLFLGLEPPG